MLTLAFNVLASPAIKYSKQLLRHFSQTIAQANAALLEDNKT